VEPPPQTWAQRVNHVITVGTKLASEGKEEMVGGDDDDGDDDDDHDDDDHDDDDDDDDDQDHEVTIRTVTKMVNTVLVSWSSSPSSPPRLPLPTPSP
jgi:hypothetical protein